MSIEAVWALTCTDCDAGENILTEAEARAMGWKAIQPVAGGVQDMPWATHVGLCPVCQLRTAQKES